MSSGTTPYANSVFEQPWWLEMVAPGKWGEVFVSEGNEIIARMPYVLEKGHVKMPPMTQTLGPWIKPEYRAFQPGNTQLSKQKEIITQLLAQLPRHRTFQMTFDSSNEYILPYRWLGYRYVPAFSYRIMSLKDTTSIYANLNKTVKKNIKYARNKTNIEIESEPDDILKLVEDTFRAQGRSVLDARERNRCLITGVLTHGSGRIIIAKDTDGNLHAGAFLLFDQNVCYYLIGGSNPQFRNSGAQSLVLWEAIQFASAVSYSFDFEGSNIESIENFFRQFGGQRVINYTVSKQSYISDCIEIAKPRIKRLIKYKN